MAQENPRIEWVEKSGEQCLKFTFKGVLDKENATIAIEKWREAFASKPDTKIVLIWDCLEMSRYDTESRVQWQNALKEMKHQIHGIWLVTQSSLIRMGASVMSMLTRLKVNVVVSEDQIKIK